MRTRLVQEKFISGNGDCLILRPESVNYRSNILRTSYTYKYSTTVCKFATLYQNTFDCLGGELEDLGSIKSSDQIFVDSANISFGVWEFFIFLFIYKKI